MYRVLLRPPAQRFLRKLRDKSLTARLVAAMRGLASQPRPPGCDKHVGPEDLYRGRGQTVDWSGLPCEGRFWERKLGPAKLRYL